MGDDLQSHAEMTEKTNKLFSRDDDNAGSYDTLPGRKSDEFIDLTKKSPESGLLPSSRPISNSLSRESLRATTSSSSIQPGPAPPKPKRDWSSLNHDYANMKVTGGGDAGTRLELSSEDTRRNGHSRQGSGDQSSRSSEFLDQQMAKLMARKGQDEADGVMMKRSKSGDSLSRKRTSEILDDDTKKILRDCQEYLLGAQDTHQSPRVNSTHSSPTNSYNKYNPRTSAGNLSLSPGSKVMMVNKSPDKSLSSPVRNTDYNSLNSDQTSSEHSPVSDGDQEVKSHEYENIAKSCYYDARGKISAAQTSARTRERRNSFRQAVDKPDSASSGPKPYEQIWFREGGGHDDDPRHSSVSDSRHLTSSTSSSSINKTQLRKSDSGSLRSQQSGHIRSGSYDNLPNPGLNTTQAIFTLDPNPTAYEIINFSHPQPTTTSVSSSRGHSGLQSASLVAEAQRDYDRASSQPKQILSKQNSGGAMTRAPPPPYQNPPPGPVHSTVVTNKPGVNSVTHVTPPKHISPTYTINRYQEPNHHVSHHTL